MQNKQSTSKGFAILSAAGIINKILALVYIPIQTHIIGNYGNGIVSAGYNIYIFIFFLSNAGIPTAISKLVSEQLALRNYKNCQRIFKTAGVILIIFGIVSSAFMALAAGWISKLVSQPKAYLMILALSPTMIFTSVSSAFRGYFQGRSNMVPTAVSQILEQAVNSCLTIVFAAILIKYGVDKAAAGTTVGTSMGAMVAALYLSYIYMKNRRHIYSESIANSLDNNIMSWKSIVREIAIFSMPAVLGTVAINMYGLVDLQLVGRLIAGGLDSHKATELYGIYTNQYQRLLNIPLALTAALPAALIPAISGANASRDLVVLGRKINEGLRAVFIILVPSAMGMAVLAKPVITLIFFSTRLNQGSDLLVMGAWTIIIIAVINIEAAILIGIGKPYISPVSMAIGLVLKALANYFLVAVPALNMKGAILATFIGYSAACFLNYIMIKRYLNISLSAGKSILKTIIAAVIMGVCVYGFYNLSHMLIVNIVNPGLILNDLCTLFSISVGAVLYVILSIKFKVVDSADIRKLPFGSRINSAVTKLGLLKSSEV